MVAVSQGNQITLVSFIMFEQLEKIFRQHENMT